jgi:hypothetical protein
MRVIKVTGLFCFFLIIKDKFRQNIFNKYDIYEEKIEGGKYDKRLYKY